MGRPSETVQAISDFVAGCKTDGVWDKITEAYLMAGVTFGGITVKLKAVPDSLEYASDFSAGVDGNSALNGTVTGNVDGIGGKDDSLSLWADGVNSSHSIILPYTSVFGATYEISFEFFIPSTNTNCDGIWFNGRGMGWSDNSPTLDVWNSATFTGTNTYGTGPAYITQRSAGSNTFIGANSPTDDLIYVRNVTVTQINSSLTNNNFVTGDYLGVGTGAGLTGDGNTKYLDTGLTRPTQGDVGYSAYVTVANTDATICFYIGAGAGGTDFSGIGRISGGTSDGFNDAGDGTGYTQVSVASRDGMFVVTSRTNSDRDLYLNWSSIATNGATATVTGDTASSLEIFRAYFTGGIPDATLTFAHVGTGLTDTEASNLSTRVNTLMTALGCNVY
jgi:hypothetical protein